MGVQNGGSLQITSKYFINGNIYGVDILPEVCKMELGDNIKTYCFDIKNEKKLTEYFGDIKFDVILDDASHINSDVIAAFKILFRKLNAGGVYIIEDLHTSYWNENYGGGYLRAESSIEFLKKFVDLLNAYHIKENNFIKNLFKENNFIKNLSEDERYVFEWLESITFYDSVAVIKKLKEPRYNPYIRVNAGDYQPIHKVK